MNHCISWVESHQRQLRNFHSVVKDMAAQYPLKLWVKNKELVAQEMGGSLKEIVVKVKPRELRCGGFVSHVENDQRLSMEPKNQDDVCIAVALAFFTTAELWENGDSVLQAIRDIRRLAAGEELTADRAFQFALAWLTGWRRGDATWNDDWNGHPPEAMKHLETQVFYTVDITCKWLESHVPPLKELAIRSRTVDFTKLICAMLVRRPPTTNGVPVRCQCADRYYSKLQFDPKAEPQRLEEAKDNYSRKVRNHEKRHSISAWDPSSLSFWDFLEYAVRNGHDQIKSGALSGGMLYPLLKKPPYYLDEVNVVVWACKTCNQKREEENVKLPEREQKAPISSYLLDTCFKCNQSRDAANDMLRHQRFHIVAGPSGGFQKGEWWECKWEKCGAIYPKQTTKEKEQCLFGHRKHGERIMTAYVFIGDVATGPDIIALVIQMAVEEGEPQWVIELAREVEGCARTKARQEQKPLIRVWTKVLSSSELPIPLAPLLTKLKTMDFPASWDESALREAWQDKAEEFIERTRESLRDIQETEADNQKAAKSLYFENLNEGN